MLPIAALSAVVNMCNSMPTILMMTMLAAMTAACGQQETHAGQQATIRCLLPEGTRLRAGDVVFRRGEGLTSQVVLAADRQGNYSHTGIVVDSCGVMLICHAVPGEPDFKGDPDRVKVDSPEHFFSSQYATMGEVCRPADSAVAARAAQVAWQVYRRNTLFDHNYDDKDTTSMYCTELVAHAFKQAGHDIVEGRGHHINLPILQADCVFPSDIYDSDFLEPFIQF